MLGDITATEAKHIARLPKVDGQRVLARYLHLDGVDLEEELRQGSFLDYHYDVLQFSTNRGMPWTEVAACLMFANTFFKHLVEERFTEAVSKLHNLATVYVETDRLRLESAKKLVHYMMTSVLSHFKLYQFVFNQEREDSTNNLQLNVEVPQNDMELKDAQTYEHWEYEHRLRNIKCDEYNLMLETQAEEDKVVEKSKKVDALISEKIKEKEVETKINLKNAESFVSSVVAEKLNVIHQDTHVDLKKMKNSADIALAIKAIPVPPDMPEQPLSFMPSDVLLKDKPLNSRKTSAKSTASSRKKGGKK